VTIGWKETQEAKKELKIPGGGGRGNVEEQNKMAVVCNIYWNSKFKIKSLLSMGGGHSTTSTQT
jgi:hypothetical protein